MGEWNGFHFKKDVWQEWHRPCEDLRRVVNELQKLRDLALPDLVALLGSLLPADFFAKAPDAQARRE